MNMLDDTDKAREDAPNPRVGDLFFKSRSVIIAGEITDKLASRAVMQLIALPKTTMTRSTSLSRHPAGMWKAAIWCTT